MASSPIDGSTQKRLNAVRLDLWTGGMRGLIFGVAAGYGSHKLARSLIKKKSQLNPNTLVLSMFVGGAVFSYVGAVVYGKHSFSYLTDMWATINTQGNSDSLSNDDRATYRSLLRKNDAEVIRDFDKAFERRSEAIKRAQQLKLEEQQRK